MAKGEEQARSDAPAFGALADAMSLGMAFQLIVSPDGRGRRFSYVAPSCQALNGVSDTAVLADPDVLYDLIPAEHRPRLAAAEADAIAGRAVFDLETPMVLPNGRTRWRRITSTPRLLPDGSSVWDGIEIDITERKAVELELEEQKRRLELAVEATDLGFWEWDLRRNTVSWSERNRRVFGLAADAPMSVETFMAVVHPDDVEAVRRAYERVRDRPEGGDFHYEHRVVRPDGQVRWILAHGRLVCDEQGPRVVVGTNLDITERRAAEARRALVMGELAHRAKNGLAVVMAIVVQSAKEVSTVQAYKEVVTARLMAMSKSQDLVTESGGRPARVSDLANRVLQPFDLARFDLDERLAGLPIDGDTAVGVALLLHELATNAVKHGALSRPEGRVSLDHIGLKAGLAQVCWRERGGPVVKAPSKTGFGSRVLAQALANQGGHVDWRFEPDGFVAELQFQVSA